ncbi:ureidoglycolate lyase [Paracraurococcus ruber]|uniref:Ureidoglycolate hydrolase n=1 Tax=Paracraurococcus ruber TaxID=77675 RepID=A0ABS1CUA2_9PROT|nr:ureidoglycolate lyase [Paracraurococcus ruber]MBK1658073.1 hypothetical protein [Paracraurococcus ruber]TDG34187.1 hypothetical protein E2C05_00050 [Paracraurococcus ruber]
MSTTPNLTRRALGALSATLAAAPALAQQRAIPALPAGNAFATTGAPPATRREVHSTRVLRAETATPANFAPFGTLLTTAGRPRLPINTYGPTLDLFREGLETDQPIEWFIVEGRPRGTGVLFLERHQQLGQAFIPLAGQGFLTVVAAPDAPEEDGLPAPQTLRAFWVPGDTPIQLHRGTWHENPMPVADGTRLLVTSHANITLAHQQSPDPRLRGLPLDLERRWYRHAGWDISVAA